MAGDRQVTVVIAGDAKGALSAIGQTESKLGGFSSALGKVASIAGGVGIGLGLTKLPGLLIGAANAAAADEAATSRLNQALENYLVRTQAATGDTGDLADGMAELTQDMKERIAAGEKLAFSDDEVRNSMQQLLAATDDYGESAKRSKLAMDLARGANIPLADATKLLGKINEDNIQVFKRMGITLAEGATEAEALAAVQAKFGGQADAYAKSTAGQFAAAKIRLGELQESVGALLIPVMVKLMEVAVPALQSISVWFEENKPKIQAAMEDIVAVFEEWFGSFRTGLEIIFPILKSFVAFIFDNKPLLILAIAAIGIAIFVALGPVSQAALAITAMITLIGFLSDNWSEIGDAITGVVYGIRDAITGAFNDAIGWVRANWPLIAILLAGPFAPLVLLATDGFGIRSALVGALESLLGEVRDAMTNIIAAIADTASDFLRWGGELAAKLAKGFLDGIASLPAKIADKLDPRKIDIPGLSLFFDAYLHAGQIAGGNLMSGLAAGIAAGSANAISTMQQLMEQLSKASGSMPSSAATVDTLMLNQERNDILAMLGGLGGKADIRNFDTGALQKRLWEIQQQMTGVGSPAWRAEFQTQIAQSQMPNIIVNVAGSYIGQRDIEDAVVAGWTTATARGRI